jgi:hypothetical protein
MAQVPEMLPWNRVGHTQVKVSVRPELAVAFKTACASNSVSVTGVLSGFMEAYSNTNTPKNGYAPNLSTKRQRRASARRILEQLERIRENEQNYMDNIPANLQGSEVFLFAEYCVELVGEAIEALETAYIAH